MKNIIVQYQGGGYEGCIWEWNFFYLDNHGEFKDLYSSGRNGIKDGDRAKAIILGSEKIYAYCLDNKEDVAELNRECLAQHVVMIAEELEKINIDMEVKCDHCGNYHDWEDICLDGLQGFGGLASGYTDKICNDCISYCDHCFEPAIVDHIKEIDGNYLCEYCYEEEIKGVEA